ncbi:MAG: BatA domain-containing protein [Anaerolineae bacterium]|nr:BatA domain-containing protein [Anaerolineae bacterium]
MSFLTPLAFALGALALPIIALYMLRLRRIEQPISSTFLWQQLVRDREANAPWQRLRLSWLLLLQLLALAALVAALARPFQTISTITGGRIVLLLDASASMGATDVTPSRFAQARQVALEMVDALGADDTMTVIRVAAVPEVLAAASRDKMVLRQAIADAGPGDAGADWLAALTLAAAGAVGVSELKVVIVSDGGLPADLPPVPGDVRYVPVGAEAGNLAISALATDSLPGRPPQLFARISNYGDQDTEVILDVRLDGSDVLYTARRYAVPARGYVDIFDIELPPDFETLAAHLTMPARAAGRDYLLADNRAYAVRDRGGAGRVLLVTGGNLFLEQIFRSLRGVELFKMAPAGALPAEPFDLVVLDGVLPADLPDADLLLINPPTGAAFFQVGAERAQVGTVAVHPADPRTRNLAVYMETVRVALFRELSGTAWATTLASVDGFPLVVAGEVGARQVAILPFDARYPNTDMVLQPAWPILIAELAAWFSPPRITDAPASLTPGAPVTVRFIEDADEVSVRLPDGKSRALAASASTAIFADTLTPGLYEVTLRKGGAAIRSESFAVNLFDAAESAIAPRESIRVGTAEISRDARQETGRREYWPWVVGAGLALLAIEWWAYHRALRRSPRLTLVGRGSGWRALVDRLRRTPAQRRLGRLRQIR